MSRIGKYCLKIRKSGQGEWIPLTSQTGIPECTERPSRLMGKEGLFDTIEAARAAKAQFVELCRGVECCIFKTVKDEYGDVEDINVDALMDDHE
jgi:hypothetical protein